MANINTLIEDIYKVLSNEKLADVKREDVQSFADRLVERIRNKITEGRDYARLRLSKLGTPCSRQLWYSVNTPERAEKLQPYTLLKYLFGDILEELLFFLARVAGHEVTDEQKAVNLHGVDGHLDGRIDGTLVDAKSCSTRAFEKFSKHKLHEDDAFGYITQLDSYREAEGDEEAYFFAIDKQFGHLALDKHGKKGVDYKKKIEETRAMLAQPVPPNRAFEPEPEGKSGNMKLGVACSYCPFKGPCWPELRTFLYAKGPVYLTKVVRQPDVPEAPK